jgi:phosphopantothenoylcysteine synthetase/decarboxylase
MGDLRVVVSGSRVAAGVGRLVDAALSRGWAVDVTATQSGLDFIDAGGIALACGKPVRTTYTYAPDGSRISPPADVMIVAPATYNTVNKLACGIADTYALSSMAEVIGRGVPTVVVPAVNTALAGRLPFRRSVEDLRLEGVRVLFGKEDDWAPVPPGQNLDPARFPWLRALDLATELTTVERHAPIPA